MEFVKFCNGLCQAELLTSKFHKGNGKFGLKSRCRECCKLYKGRPPGYSEKYYSERKDELNIQHREYYERNKIKCQNIVKRYEKLHRAEKSARESFRRAQKLNATPPWLTKEHRKQIEDLYKLRDELTLKTGIIHHVDHIVPLINENVCGLHVPWNLRVIPGVDNLKKSNKVVELGLV